MLWLILLLLTGCSHPVQDDSPNGIPHGVEIDVVARAKKIEPRLDLDTLEEGRRYAADELKGFDRELTATLVVLRVLSPEESAQAARGMRFTRSLGPAIDYLFKKVDNPKKGKTYYLFDSEKLESDPYLTGEEFETVVQLK